MKRFGRIAKLLAVVAVLIGLLVSCDHHDTNCPSPTRWVEAQSWWTSPNGGDNFGHGHEGACLPERDLISEPITIPVRVVLHENPGTLAYISVVTKTVDQEITQQKIYPTDPFGPCAETCEQWFDMPLDPAWFNYSGLQEIRYRAFIDEPTGDRMIISLNWQAYIQNGNSAKDVTRMPYLRGKGWYTRYEYCESSFLSVPLPDGPVSGIWSPNIQQVNHDASALVTWHHVAIDPNFHMGDPGIVLSDGAGQLPAGPINIDTTTLANGKHKLMQKVDCNQVDVNGFEQTNSGLLVVEFTVEN